jgi:hypothetical protein
MRISSAISVCPFTHAEETSKYTTSLHKKHEHTHTHARAHASTVSLIKPGSIRSIVTNETVRRSIDLAYMTRILF